MTRRSRFGLAFVVLMSAGLIVAGCSAAKSTSGSGGSSAVGTGGSDPTGSGGSGGSGSGGSDATGSGGSIATGSGGSDVIGSGGAAGASSAGGAGGAGGASVPLPLACPANLRNKSACVTDTDMPCNNGCGPSKTGFKNCNCYSNVWDCPKCEYLPGDYSCYKLPSPLNACPMDSVDPTMPPMVGTPCTEPPCTPCGSAPLNTYRDSMGLLKAGYCVCVPGADTAKWSCASVNEWPPQQ